MSDNDTWRKVNQLDRERIVELLEGIGVACYDDEATQLLREALVESVRDGNIDRDHLLATEYGDSDTTRWT